MFNNRSIDKIIALGPYINQAVLDPHITEDNLLEQCDAARHFGFGGLCTNLNNLETSRSRLGRSSTTKLIGTIAFPFGSIPNELKIKEAEWASQKGAEEIDLVPNFSALSKKNYDQFAEEISEICSIDLPVTVILNISNIDSEQLKFAIEATIEAGSRGIQTHNGFGHKATSNEMRQLRDLVKGRCQIKAVGGINSLAQTIELIEAGATRIGTTKGIDIIKAFRTKTSD